MEICFSFFYLSTSKSALQRDVALMDLSWRSPKNDHVLRTEKSTHYKKLLFLLLFLHKPSLNNWNKTFFIKSHRNRRAFHLKRIATISAKPTEQLIWRKFLLHFEKSFGTQAEADADDSGFSSQNQGREATPCQGHREQAPGFYFVVK